MNMNEASGRLIYDVNGFADMMEQRNPHWKVGHDGALSVEYVTVNGANMCLAIDEEQKVRRSLDGKEVDLGDYPLK